MLAKYAAAAMAGSMLLASAAFAAEDTTTTTAPKASASTADKAGMSQGSVSDVSYTGTWRASKVVGLNVYNEQNENVGSINDLLMDKSGNVKAAVISVGGFLGLGSRYVAIAFDKMKFSDQPVAYTGASNAPAGGSTRPASSTTTGSTANPPTAAPAASKPNPWYPDHAMLNATKDELQNMPEFKYAE
jgi:sporulation protein YlmC with PRC-barrel domain